MKLILSLILIFFGGTSYSQQSYFERGVDFFYKGGYAVADSFFSISIQYEPSNFCDAVRQRGVTRLLRSDTSASDKDIELAINTCPENANVYYSKGICFFIKSDYFHSIQSYTKAISLNPKRIDFYINRSISYGLSGDTSNFKSDNLKALQIDSTSSRASNNIAVYYKNTTQFQKAIPYFKRAIKYEPGQVDFYISLALCELKTGEYEEALTLCNGAINKTSAEEKLGQILLIRGQIFIAVQRLTEGCIDLKKASAMNQPDAKVFLREILQMI